MSLSSSALPWARSVPVVFVVVHRWRDFGVQFRSTLLVRVEQGLPDAERQHQWLASSSGSIRYPPDPPRRSSPCAGEDALQSCAGFAASRYPASGWRLEAARDLLDDEEAYHHHIVVPVGRRVIILCDTA